jgi:hypothetical protein
MSTASIPYLIAGGNLGIAAEYDRIGLSRKPKLSATDSAPHAGHVTCRR